MLGNAIDACPDELWRDKSRDPQFWYLAFHTLFYLDLYLFGSVDGFMPPAPLAWVNSIRLVLFRSAFTTEMRSKNIWTIVVRNTASF